MNIAQQRWFILRNFKKRLSHREYLKMKQTAEGNKILDWPLLDFVLYALIDILIILA